MRAREFIKEVVSLDSPGPETKWYTTKDLDAYRSPTVQVGSWTDPTGNQIKSEFRKDSGSPGQTDIRFTRTLPDTHPDYHPAGTMGITGTGKQETPRVLGGVVKNVKTFLDKNPDQRSITFSSEQPSRTRLYSKMVDRLAPQMGMVGTKVDRDGGAATFQLTRAGEGEKHQPISKPREKAITTKTPPPPPPLTAKTAGIKAGGGSGGVGVPDARDMALGAELDPKTMMQRMAR